MALWGKKGAKECHSFDPSIDIFWLGSFLSYPVTIFQRENFDFLAFDGQREEDFGGQMMALG